MNRGMKHITYHGQILPTVHLLMGNSFSTIWTGWKEKRLDSQITIPDGQLTRQIRWKYLDKEFSVSMNTGSEIIIETVYFPGWRVYIDNIESQIQYKEDGRIHVFVSAGTHDIHVIFVDTWPRRIGNGIFLLSLVTPRIAVYCNIRKKHEYSHRYYTILVMRGCSARS